VAIVRLPLHDRLGVSRRLIRAASECGLPTERLVVGPIDYTVFRVLADAGATGSIHLGDDALDIRDAADLVARFGTVARRRVVVGTATRSGPFDVLAAARFGSVLSRRGVGEATVDAVLYRNAAERFGVIADR
jgi:predicted metal-dependent TIM-barrel fold hydrolase